MFQQYIERINKVRVHKQGDGCCEFPWDGTHPIPETTLVGSCDLIRRAISNGHMAAEWVPWPHSLLGLKASDLWKRNRFLACLEHAWENGDTRFWIDLADCGLRLRTERYCDINWIHCKFQQALFPDRFLFLATLFEAGCSEFLHDLAPGILIIAKSQYHDRCEAVIRVLGSCLPTSLLHLVQGYGLC